MRFYLTGAATPDQLRAAEVLGASGILCSPGGLLEQFGREATLEEMAHQLREAVDIPVFLPVHGPDPEALVGAARRLCESSPRLGVSILGDTKGLLAIGVLQREGINCIATGVFSVGQGLLAARARAYGVAPYYSLAQEQEAGVMDLIATLEYRYGSMKKAPMILAADLRTLDQVEQALGLGAHGVGVPFPLLLEMTTHPLTQQLEAGYGKLFGEIKGEDTAYLAAMAQPE